MELIIIDDGSTDDSLKILEKYSDEKNNCNQTKESGPKYYKQCCDKAIRGRYIVRVDADDYVDENFLTVLSSVLDDKPDIGLVFPDYHHVDPDGNILETIREKR